MNAKVPEGLAETVCSGQTFCADTVCHADKTCYFVFSVFLSFCLSVRLHSFHPLPRADTSSLSLDKPFCSEAKFTQNMFYISQS